MIAASIETWTLKIAKFKKNNIEKLERRKQTKKRNKKKSRTNAIKMNICFGATLFLIRTLLLI